jgi:hypothetical protein
MYLSTFLLFAVYSYSPHLYNYFLSSSACLYHQSLFFDSARCYYVYCYYITACSTDMLAAIPTYVSNVNNHFFHVFLFAKSLNQVSFSFVFHETMRNKILHVFCFTKCAKFCKVKLLSFISFFYFRNIRLYAKMETLWLADSFWSIPPNRVMRVCDKQRKIFDSENLCILKTFFKN